MNDGKLVDDFLIVKGQNSIHVCNAPSSATTSAIGIGKAIVEQIRNSSIYKQHVMYRILSLLAVVFDWG
jgi:L-2-hydroxyglutarate oxidase